MLDCKAVSICEKRSEPVFLSEGSLVPVRLFSSLRVLHSAVINL